MNSNEYICFEMSKGIHITETAIENEVLLKLIFASYHPLFYPQQAREKQNLLLTMYLF